MGIIWDKLEHHMEKEKINEQTLSTVHKKCRIADSVYRPMLKNFIERRYKRRKLYVIATVLTFKNHSTP